MMKSVQVVEAKAKFSLLLSLVESGQSIAITRHGKIVARSCLRRPGLLVTFSAMRTSFLQVLHWRRRRIRLQSPFRSFELMAKRYLLDTNIVIAGIRGHKGVLSHFDKIEPGRLVLSSIVVGELLTGVEKSDRPEQSIRAFEGITQQI